MRHGSLFSGGGGFDLAADFMGWRNVFHCEIDPFCKQVLSHYWPNSDSIGDIRNFNAKQYRGKIEILTGGFPCQPFSLAGKRRGSSDSRYLWPEMLRIIREVKPKWVIGENVYGILNWSDGLVFEQVHADLEKEGYEVQAFILPACGVNAPHRRNRVWFVGYNQHYQNDSYTHGNGRQRRHCKNEKQSIKARKHAQRNPMPMGCHDTDRYRKGLEGRKEARNTQKGWKKIFKQFARQCRRGYWRKWPTQSPVCGRNDGLPCKLDGITISRWRRESIKMYGNAIVPQVTLQIFKAIEMVESQN